MATVKVQETIKVDEKQKAEFYRFIGEGYKAMQEGRTSTIDEVRKKLRAQQVNLG